MDRQGLEWYTEDLPSPSTLAEVRCGRENGSPSVHHQTPYNALLNCSDSLYPNVSTVLRIVSERSSSTLGLVETRLRTSMSEERLSSLYLISIHWDIDINIKTERTLEGWPCLKRHFKVTGYTLVNKLSFLKGDNFQKQEVASLVSKSLSKWEGYS